MGICNVTPDSFSDGGRYFSKDDAFARVRELMEEGADFIDVGGESTRPGAPAVPAGDQITRVRDVIARAVDAGACVTIDTASPLVAGACLDAGACAVNDVSCLREPGLAGVCASNGAALVLMHSREPMSELRAFSSYPDDAYGDVVADVMAEWRVAAERAVSEGLPPDAILMDPGLGFAKNARQSAALLAATGRIAGELGVPVVVGASRKSFLTIADPSAGPMARLGASLAAALFAARAGAAVLRVHDVRATRQAIDLDRALTSVARSEKAGVR